MRTLKLVVAYDGSAYHGFQKQKNAVTVQNILEEAAKTPKKNIQSQSEKKILI